MALFNVEGAKLSVAQVWVALAIAGGMLAVSILRENKPANNTQETLQAVERLENKVDNLVKTVDKNTEATHVNAEQLRQTKNMVDDLGEEMMKNQKSINGDFSELISIGKFYINNKERLDEEQMKEIIEDWVKKNGWNRMLGETAYAETPSNSSSETMFSR